MDEKQIAAMLTQKAEKMKVVKVAQPLSVAKDHFEKALKSLNKAREIVVASTDYKKKILFQHLIMTIGFTEGLVENFDKYSTNELLEDAITKNDIDPDNVITYMKETNVEGIKKFPDEWKNNA